MKSPSRRTSIGLVVILSLALVPVSIAALHSPPNAETLCFNYSMSHDDYLVHHITADEWRIKLRDLSNKSSKTPEAVQTALSMELSGLTENGFDSVELADATAKACE